MLSASGCAHSPVWRELKPGIEIRSDTALPRTLVPGGAPAESRVGRQELRFADGTLLQFELFPGVDSAEARRRIAGKREALRNLYQKRVEPYYGVVDGGEYCDLAQLPPERFADDKGMTRLVLHLWATENLVYGVCEPQEIRYKSQLLLLYCEAERTYAEVRAFYPRAGEWRIEPIGRCRRP